MRDNKTMGTGDSIVTVPLWNYIIEQGFGLRALGAYYYEMIFDCYCDSACCESCRSL